MKRAALLLVGLLIALVVLEIGARLFISKPQQDVVPPSVGHFDPYLGWALQAGSVAVSSRTGEPILYRINSKGLRDVETPYEKSNGVFRIVLLGCSRTFGYGVPIEKHFSTLLEGYFKNVEVINMGVNGFGVDQCYLYLMSEGFKYQPDMVIVYVAHYGGYRHMHTNQFGRQKPAFEFKDGKLAVQNVPVPTPGWIIRERSLGPAGKFKRVLHDHCRAYAGLRNAVNAFRRMGQQRENVKAVTPETADQDADPVFQEKVNSLAVEIVDAMRTACASNHVELLLLTQIPSLEKSAGERRIRCVSVSAALDNPSFDLPYGFQHVNESGNGVLAWEIAKHLREQDLVPDRQRSKLAAAN